jgi:hypothetical protein
MNRGFLIIIVLGAVGFVVGCREWQLKTVARETPRTISAAELIAQGYGDNANVVVTGVEFCPNFVYEENQKTHKWSKVWIPAVPAGQGCGGNIRLIVTDTSCDGPEDLPMLNTGSVQGLIINKIASIGGQEKKLLEEEYGPVADCLILERNRGTWPATGVIAMMGVGGLAFFSGLALTAAQMQKR